MTQPEKTRRQRLEEFVAQHPHDAFARYGLALECANAGDHEAALGHFRKLIASNPDYVPGFQQLGQLLARLGQRSEAREIFARGIELARAAGEQRALEEMEAALRELEA
jgi:tetratricopeptide (TPR) repeat protein